MTYKTALADVFPYVFPLLPEDAAAAVAALTDLNRLDVPYGSSFALTTDGTDGRQNLWLSEASYHYLEKSLVLEKSDQEILELWWDTKIAAEYDHPDVKPETIERIRSGFIQRSLEHDRKHNHSMIVGMRRKLTEEGKL